MVRGTGPIENPDSGVQKGRVASGVEGRSANVQPRDRRLQWSRALLYCSRTRIPDTYMFLARHMTYFDERTILNSRRDLVYSIYHLHLDLLEGGLGRRVNSGRYVRVALLYCTI